MKEIITIFNRRGGAGKTTTAQAVGAGLARKGYKTLFIDLDSQRNLTSDVGGTTDSLTSMDLLTGRATAEEAIQHTAGGDIIPASQSLAEADTVIIGTGKEYRLKEALEPVLSMYDYFVVDTPPALGVLTVNALTASTSLIIPVQAEKHSLEGVIDLYQTIQTVRRYTNPGLEVKGLLLTRYRGRTILSRDMRENLEAIASQLNTKVFSTPIRECIAVPEAQASDTDIYSYDKRSNASKDYTALVEELLEGER